MRLANGHTKPQFGLVSPHYWPLLGNCDFIVLNAALQTQGKVLSWSARDRACVLAFSEAWAVFESRMGALQPGWEEGP